MCWTPAPSDMLPPNEALHGFELIAAADVLVYFGDLLDLITSFGKLERTSADRYVGLPVKVLELFEKRGFDQPSPPRRSAQST